MQKQITQTIVATASLTAAFFLWIIHFIVTTAGHISLHASNELSNQFAIDSKISTPITDAIMKLQQEQYPWFYDWTIGVHNNTAGYLAILMAVIGIVTIVTMMKKNNEMNGKK